MKDFNEIVDYKTKAIEISKGLRFIEIICPSINDAQKRASIFAHLTYSVKNNSFIKLFSAENLNDAFFLSNIREIWKTYCIKNPEDLKLFIQKDKDAKYRNQQLKHNKLASAFPHSGFILHQEDVSKVDENNLFEIQGDRKMNYMKVFFSVSKEFMAKVKSDIEETAENGERKERSIIQIKAKNKPELTEETFLSKRDKLVRINRAQQEFNMRFISPEDRIGTQLNPFRANRPSLVSKQQINEFNFRPDTEKAHKRVLSTGLSLTKESTKVNSKILKGFGISVRTLYGKHTPLAFSNFSGANTPANEYGDTTKSWMMNNKRKKVKEVQEK